MFDDSTPRHGDTAIAPHSALAMSRRHPAALLSAIFAVIGSAAVVVSIGCAENQSLAGLLLNLGTELIGISLTILFVDRLLEKRAERQFRVAVRPRLQDAYEAHKEVEFALSQLPAAPLPDDLLRYFWGLDETLHSLHHLSSVLLTRDARHASDLASYGRKLRRQKEITSQAITDERNRVLTGTSVEALRTSGVALAATGEDLFQRLLREYSPTKD